MENEPNIDYSLREWAGRQASAPTQVRALEDRIVAAYRAQPDCSRGRWPRSATSGRGYRSNGDGADAHHFDVRRRNLLCFVAGIAATLLVVVLVRVGGGDRRDLAPLLREEGSLFAGHKPAMSRVFCETERLFGSNLQWVAQSGHSAELGLVDAPVGNGRAMIVHLSVVARRAGDAKGWQRIWQADVVARSDGVVELTPDGIPGNHVALWLHRLDDGKTFVESRLDLCQPLKMEAETSEVLTFGASRDVTRIRHGDTEYLLLQTVSPAGGKVCSS